MTCDLPNADLYKFTGTIQLADGSVFPLSNEQVLLKGCQLRNTATAYGISVYTGHQTKVMLNALKSRPKKSKIEVKMNFYILFLVLIQFTICLLACVTNGAWTLRRGEGIWYLGFAYTEQTSQTYFQLFVVEFMLWFVALMNFVPISLLVTVELVKFAQAYFIMQDHYLYDISKDIYGKVQSSNLNEELGMVTHIFSDKTGTLTQNIMEFKQFSAGGIAYGKADPRLQTYAPGVTNVNFEDDSVWLHLQNPESYPHLRKFVECLGICHTVIVESKAVNGKMANFYNASSPDELALVNGMRHFGFSFAGRDEEDNIVIEQADSQIKYKLLHIIEFNSDRKRMSVIVRTYDGRVMIVCKGADSIINARLAPGEPYLGETN